MIPNSRRGGPMMSRCQCIMMRRCDLRRIRVFQACLVEARPLSGEMQSENMLVASAVCSQMGPKRGIGEDTRPLVDAPFLPHVS